MVLPKGLCKVCQQSLVGSCDCKCDSE